MAIGKVNLLAGLLAPALVLVAGCGGRVSGFGGVSASAVQVHADANQIDTNGTTKFTATMPDGQAAKVVWTVSGGDPAAGAGKISADGVYTPPNFLTRDAVSVAVSADLAGKVDEAGTGSAELLITPGFLQPLTPGNLSLGPGGTVTISSSMTEVGGNGGIHFALASDPAGSKIIDSGREAGSLGAPKCARGSVSGSNPAYTVCSVTYTAPAALQASGSVFIVGSVASNPVQSWTRVLLNSAGITSNPAGHQAHLAVPVLLGSSSGNNGDYDANLGQLTDCCGGTMGALLQDTGGNQYVLSNNHVLARSDQSLAGETVIQPGLIDNGCTPFGFGPGTTQVATLTGYPALNSAATNVDAAIARVVPGAVDPRGYILELGTKQADGTLAAAPPGVSSTGGKGETVALGMMVAKSGRTTGLTCAAVSAVNVDVVVDYFTDCAETTHSLSKTFTNQIAMSGTSFTDAGDSGALVVDSANAEPVGLFFAGGTDAHGVEHAIASPIGDVLAALDAQVPGASGPTEYSVVGGADHPVSCLRYDSTSVSDDGVAGLSASERQRAEAALPLAQVLIPSLSGPGIGALRTVVVASKDHPGLAAVGLYPAQGANGTGQVMPTAIPVSIGGVATSIRATEPGAAGVAQPSAASLATVLAVKQRNSSLLMKTNPAIFGVGVGQSLDNPNDAALVLFVDRRKTAGVLPEFVEGQRVRVISMDRLHVTKSHGQPTRRSGSCGLARDFQPMVDALPLP